MPAWFIALTLPLVMFETWYAFMDIMSSNPRTYWIDLPFLVAVGLCLIRLAYLIVRLCQLSCEPIEEEADLPATTSVVSLTTPAIVAAPEPSAQFPSQDEWTRRAGEVRNPVSGLAFRFQARSNARALQEEQKRITVARGVLKEYTGMYKDLLEGHDAATAYGVRRDVADHYVENERAKQEEEFAESAHKRRLAAKRRDKESIEGDTRTTAARHAQEAEERFKEPKFQAGMARFEAMLKERLVGAATADAAIAETKAPAADTSGNENNEVVALYKLLQDAMAAIEEGERVGRDTQGLHERVELYKKLLNLS